MSVADDGGHGDCDQARFQGPGAVRQNRYGYNDNEIRVFKFRSMYTDQSDFTAERQTTREDPRITRVGRIIRKTSIDEAAAVVQRAAGQTCPWSAGAARHGDQGRRCPVRSGGERVQLAPPREARHHRLGRTDQWLRGETDTLFKIQKRVEYDLEYISKWSVWFDLYIVFMTVPAVLSTKEVY